MKRIIALVIAVAMIAGAALPLASQALSNKPKDEPEAVVETDFSAEAEAPAEEESVSRSAFDEAISSLYDNSMNVTDEEVLAAAEQMPSDFAQVEAALGDEAQGAVECLKSYEAQKAGYMLQEQDGTSSDAIREEWERQMVYTSFLISEGDDVTALVPRMKVKECTYDGSQAELQVYEWMTIGYSSDGGPVNAAAYGYDYALTLAKDESGWTVAGVYDTDQNFDWMEQEAEEAAQVGSAVQDSQRVVSEDGTAMMAASKLAYSYSRDAAIKYGDKYCIDYNPSYNSYKGKGGDCANFVSQCLYAGGFPTDGTWYKHSVAWINVMKQIAHFKQYGLFMNADNGNILRGNPLFFDWNGDSTWDHATICVGRNNNGVAIIDSHTKDLYHSQYTYASYKKISTIQLRDSSAVSPETAAAGGSWRLDSVGWWYRNADGSYPKNTFMVIGGTTYHFNKSGYMDTGWVYVSGKYYYFDESGAMLLRWKRIDGLKYFLDPYDGHMHTGWEYVTEKGGWYYLDPNLGHMREGWVYAGAWYYLKPGDGIMMTGWIYVNGLWYYMNPGQGYMQRGWLKYKNNWYYLDMKNGDMKTGFITVNNKTYYMTPVSGEMVTGWQTIEGRKYYFDTSGAMATGTQRIDGQTYHFSSDGHLE